MRKKNVFGVVFCLVLASGFCACARPATDSSSDTSKEVVIPAADEVTIPDIDEEEKVVVETTQEMSTTDLAEYVTERVVTVTNTMINGNTGTGTGFFIDDEGTIMTNYHVIDLAQTLTVQTADGGSYDVVSVVNFSPT